LAQRALQLAGSFALVAPAEQAVLATIFDGLNTYLGNFIGEFLGELAVSMFFLLTSSRGCAPRSAHAGSDGLG